MALSLVLSHLLHGERNVISTGFAAHANNDVQLPVPFRIQHCLSRRISSRSVQILRILAGSSRHFFCFAICLSFLVNV